jgi:hypothetical protein
MRQAIITKYISPTNHRGSRIKVQCEAKTKFYPYRYDLNILDNHEYFANELMKELGWNESCKLVGGMFDGQGYFVQVSINGNN